MISKDLHDSAIALSTVILESLNSGSTMSVEAVKEHITALVTAYSGSDRAFMLDVAADTIEHVRKLAQEQKNV